MRTHYYRLFVLEVICFLISKCFSSFSFSFSFSFPPLGDYTVTAKILQDLKAAGVDSPAKQIEG